MGTFSKGLFAYPAESAKFVWILCMLFQVFNPALLMARQRSQTLMIPGAGNWKPMIRFAGNDLKYQRYPVPQTRKFDKPGHKMKFSSFEQSLLSDKPPEMLSVYLKALWYERKGQWDKAHSLVDHLEEKEAARIHAYLHRKEGDSSNARYWYQRAGTAWPSMDTDGEWKELARQFSQPD